MTRIVVDEALLGKLRNLTETLELVNSDGRVLAKVLPSVDLSEYELTEPPPLTEEEIQRRLDPSEPRYTTAEVLAYLEKL